MSANRIAKFNRVRDLLGDIVRNAEALTGWPGFLSIGGAIGDINVALHVSQVSPHARRDHEVRFQNPANAPPVSSLQGRGHPVLLAMDSTDHDTVFVAVDGTSRLGRATRFSILFNRRILAEAREFGWAVYESKSGEKVYAFLPALFPAFLEQIDSGIVLPSSALTEVAAASGVIEEESTAAANRASRAVNILIRTSGAGRSIRSAYANTCCMCGIGSSLVVGAHIFPVEAPGSSDEVWNGLSLCYNHHAAFDLHLIWIDPITRRVVIHPDLILEAIENTGTRSFIESTGACLMAPIELDDSPRREMFEQRYSYFSGKYNWARNLPRQ
jgi:hypothetical protein